MENIFLNMILGGLSSEPKKETDFTVENNTDNCDNSKIMIPIIHNKVSQIAKFADIKEPCINFGTLERVKKELYNARDKDIDLLIDTNGGDLNAVKMICDTLHTYKRKYPENKIRAYVQYLALSGGTLIALCADELYLSDYAHLGLVDPQILGMSYDNIKDVIRAKNSNAWDVTHILSSMAADSHSLVDRLLFRILAKNPKYYPKMEGIREHLLKCGVHGAGITVTELEGIGIIRDGDIPPEIDSLFGAKRSEHIKENNTGINKFIC